MSKRYLVLAWLLTASACAGSGSPGAVIERRDVVIEQSDFVIERLDLTHPVLRFEVLRVGSAGTVESMSGTVEAWTLEGWRTLAIGSRLEHGARVQVAANAALTIRFAERERIEFRPAPTERGFELNVVGATPGT